MLQDSLHLLLEVICGYALASCLFHLVINSFQPLRCSLAFQQRFPVWMLIKSDQHRRRNRGGWESQGPPIFYLLIFIHAVQIAVIAVCIMFAPPQNGIASYAYD